ncbi:MAG: acyloxyacyl hydrolase [Flavobacterium sp.]|nr:acyloxyacyl hydrolase [Flavobacterium sp.]
MKKFFLMLFFAFGICFGQKQDDTAGLEITYFRGNVLPHTTDLYHLQGHPEGFMVSALMKTHGKKEWHSAYNFPDYGVYFLYQNYNNEFLGRSYATGGLYNFYFLKRHLKLLLCQGITYATNPYNKEFNSKNKAFGTELLANTNIGFSFKDEKLIGKIGFEAGILLTHSSNGRIKSPNSGINTYLLNMGLSYNFENKSRCDSDSLRLKKSSVEAVHFDLFFKTGVNESPIINSGQHPFYHFGIYADKRLNRKSGLQLGTELFLTTSIKDYIKYKSVAFPELGIDPNTDYKRVGVFVGHELFVNKISIVTQVGYYVYRPFKDDISMYDRLGLKYYISKNVAVGFDVKTHLFFAEALEFGIDYRL